MIVDVALGVLDQDQDEMVSLSRRLYCPSEKYKFK
jgi:hypothetical protein